MTIDTSREAVEALNRDAWVSDAMTSTTELEQRIRDV